MTVHWADLALTAAIVVAGCGATYFLVLGTLRRLVAENQREMEHRLAALTEAIRMRATDLSDTDPGTDALTATEIEDTADVAGARLDVRDVLPGPGAAEQKDEQIPQEIKAAIAAAAIAALGNHAQVRSARSVPSSNVVSPWTQQGRVIVQSSHNLRTRG